jgi:hypothetical protein
MTKVVGLIISLNMEQFFLKRNMFNVKNLSLNKKFF